MSSISKTCVLMGDQTLLVECAKVLIDRGHSLGAVVTGSSQVSSWAERAGIRVLSPGKDLAQHLTGVAYDWFFSIANLRLVPEAVWAKAVEGAVNFHDGPLPRYAGLNTPSWAILAGETEYAVTWHRITTGIDEGAIIAQERFEISEDDTALSLNTKCFAAGLASFAQVIERIERGDGAGEAQDLSRRTYFSKFKRPPAGGSIDFSAPSADIERQMRALTFGEGYANPLGLPKVTIGGRTVNVHAIQRDEAASDAAPGTILSSDAAGALIATADGAVRLSKLTDALGMEVSPAEFFRPGQVVLPVPASLITHIDKLVEKAARSDDFFSQRIFSSVALELYGFKPVPPATPSQWSTIEFAIPTALPAEWRVGAIAATLARISGQTSFTLPYADDDLPADVGNCAGFVAPLVPVHIEAHPETTCAQLLTTVADEITGLRRRGCPSADLWSRLGKSAEALGKVAIRFVNDPATAKPAPSCTVTIAVPGSGASGRIAFDAARMPPAEAASWGRRLSLALASLAGDRAMLVGDLPLLSREETLAILHARNDSVRKFDRGAVVHSLIEAQASRTPSATAVVCEDTSLTYAELDVAANRLAHELIRAGVSAGALVGLYLRRSVDLVISALAVWKAGGAYVPLDPSYPADRIALMIEDSHPAAIITDGRLHPPVGSLKIPIVPTTAPALATAPSARPELRAQPSDLAYVIYTSGSTGRPKGVMVEHRNVVNFFVGMDERVPNPKDRQPVWLAVTSLSFDISVLELFWTLARGFKVVMHADRQRAPAATARKSAAHNLGLSLYYWGNDDGPGPLKYRLLLEGARFADTHGFEAVWTPERHFGAFGGPYPNPSVTGAAVAAITSNVKIRAGSCVLPLHHPARVAEEWAVVDNISNGRVGVSFAAGWMPEDFVLRPENAPPRNKTQMLNDIVVVQKLWRGEKVSFASGGGTGMVEVTTLPRPVQPELPIWVTAAGNPETFREAGRLGANMLTHLLGQSLDEVGEKIKIYRQALAEAGFDPASRKVTLMLHTLIGDDRDEVREIARAPMISYLRSAVSLIKQYAWAFPAFKRPKGVDKPLDLDLETLDREEMDAILEFAFLRYFEDSGLFGTVEDGLARADQVRGIGVDEIACLIDFGAPVEAVLRALEPLGRVVAEVNKNVAVVAQAEPASDHGIAALIRRHGVTHLQCTPAMGSMFLHDDEIRTALGEVAHLFLGGEALDGRLLRELRKVTAATIENMYGPTETTIWSSTAKAEDTDSTVPLGTPIANTQLYVLDEKQRPVPDGMPGELYIGGDGVTRGYLGREELTREKFVANPFVAGGRMYRTGDLVRWDHDGHLAFIGRTDYQVKVRGYRIELGEIEARLQSYGKIAEAVVTAREDTPGDVRLVAYLRMREGEADEQQLRSHLLAALPEFMVPSHFVTLDRFPLTPNAKVDRKALPPPQQSAKAASPAAYVAPDSDLEKQIAESFRGILGVERVGLLDNFFLLGGHSLLAVQVHRDLKARVAPELTITDIYRYPTVSGLCSRIRDRGTSNKDLQRVASRAASRREALENRRLAINRQR